ncbi:hypothetical protein EB796_003999 [Bugula neritina]|uniref:Uncharacterized protein n=1 Tax=Bugula neritina TaxID=10212 RepID=A0A7J7KIF3_BUGNE|nr:hypothetical protein EB796_003999 [Bugula neritina]
MSLTLRKAIDDAIETWKSIGSKIGLCATLEVTGNHLMCLRHDLATPLFVYNWLEGFLSSVGMHLAKFALYEILY